jgi:hypothetical protein
MRLLDSAHQKERGQASLICTSLYDFNKTNFTVLGFQDSFPCTDLELQQEGNIPFQPNLTFLCPEASHRT